MYILNPARQPDKHQNTSARKQGPDGQTLNHNLCLEPPERRVLDLELAVEYHQPGDAAQEGIPSAPRRLSLSLGRSPLPAGPVQPAPHAAGDAVVVKPLPRQRLAAREQEQEEAAAAEPGQDKGHADPPQRPGGEGVPARVRPDKGVQGAQEYAQEAGGGQDDAERGGDADGLVGAVGHAEADKVAVRAVLEQAVDVVRHGPEVVRVAVQVAGLGAAVGADRRHALAAGDVVLDGAEAGVARRRRHVEFLLGPRHQVRLDHGPQLGAVAQVGVEHVLGREGGCAGGRRRRRLAFSAAARGLVAAHCAWRLEGTHAVAWGFCAEGHVHADHLGDVC